MINLRKFYIPIIFKILFISVFNSFLLSCDRAEQNYNKTSGRIIHTRDSDSLKKNDDLSTKTTFTDTIVLKNNNFSYNLRNPDCQYKLPGSLLEISGISFYKKNKIACIQDENAIIYIFNLEKKKITDKYEFGKDGDYEDIAIIDKTAYVLKNNGEIYKIKDFKNKKRKIKKYKTALSLKNNTEGLCYDPFIKALLIACKGSPSVGKSVYERKKAIYKFDLKEKEFISKPHILVNIDKIEEAIGQNSFTRFSITLAKKLNIINDDIIFQPSGIAVHPITRQIYVISSTGKLLIVLDRKGKILEVFALDNKLFIQPEGICFSSEGDLYISNEGREGKGNILKFNYNYK